MKIGQLKHLLSTADDDIEFDEFICSLEKILKAINNILDLYGDCPICNERLRKLKEQVSNDTI